MQRKKDESTRSVLFVSPHVDHYGAEKSMMTYVKYIKGQGITPILILPWYGSLVEDLKKEEIEYCILRYFLWIDEKKKIMGIIKYILNYFCAIYIFMWLKKKNYTPCLVHTNSVVTPFGVQLSKVLRVPHIQHIREFGTLDFDMKFTFSDNFISRVLNQSKEIICISDAVKEYYEKKIIGTKIVTIYNGVEINEKKNKNKLKEKCGFYILLIGRLSKEKGQIDVIKAVSSLIKNGYQDIYLHMYGDGKDYDKLNDLIYELGVGDNVKLCGYSENIDMQNYDVGIMASKNEAFGRVTVEYMLNGLPVIGTNSGGTKEIVVDGITGYTFSKGNIDEIKRYIVELYQNPVLKRKMGNFGKKRAMTLFTKEKYCREIYHIYEKYIG